jgi:hypothetical protein
MRRSLTISALLALAPLAPLSAQAKPKAETEQEREAVLAVVQRLFDGMRARDSAAVRATFHPEARLIATGEQEGVPSIRVIPADGFVAAIGGGDEEWDEPFWDSVVQVQDNLATVWTRYAFYRAGTFSHCGVDAFILTRTEDGWQIVSIADTRQREGCVLPPDR